MANSFIYYLKYRPQALDQLIGQDSVKKTLLSSFLNNKLSHAYLLVGPRGTGKTSTARILAKMVNCEKSSVVSHQSSDKESLIADSEAILKTDSYPCNKCSTCLSITDGSNLDLIEIDAASNRGIEDIRSLRDKIKLAPSSARKKVYIIDECHMLSTEAFNALLKTLEEPPAHALFILATTDAVKIPQTILSRVQRLDFKLATAEQLTEALKRIVTEEKIDIDEEALQFLVKKSDGSFRDGVKLLDQLASSNEKITVKLLTENFKSSQFDGILDLIQSLISKNASKGLLNVIKQMEYGVDIKDLILSLMDTLRNLMLIKNGVGEELVKFHFTEDKYQQLVKLAEGLSVPDLAKNLDVLQNSLEKLKFTSIPSLPLELAVVEMCEGQSSVISHQSLESEESAQEKLDVRSEKLDGEVGSLKLEDHSHDQISNIQPQNPVSNLQHPISNDDIVKLKEKWTVVLETIRSVNFSLEALLRSGNITECKGATIIIEVPYAFHQRILEAPKNRELLEGVFSDVLGRTIRLSTVLGNRPTRQADIVNIGMAEDDEIIRAAAEIFNSDSVN